MLKDISVFLDKIIFLGYEVLSVNLAENNTHDLCFVIDNDERYLAMVNMRGSPKKTMNKALKGIPISVNTENTSKHTGLQGDDYVLYHGKFVTL